MCAKKKEMRASGEDSIVFRQRMDYPSRPGQITYYPPEPSPDLKKQVDRDKAGGIIFYFLGVVLALMGLGMALDRSGDMEIYASLIPISLIIGLIAAFFYLYTNNVALAKLSRSLPAILMVALTLLYITGIILGMMDLSNIQNENDIPDAIDALFGRLVAPAFFFISVGLMVARAGGTLLWTSSRVRYEYVPGTIILEAPEGHTMPSPAPLTASQTTSHQAISSPPQDAAPGISEPCTKCGKPSTYIEEYDSYFCYSCNEYVEFPAEDTGSQAGQDDEPSGPAASKCKTCGKELRYINEYDRYYCDSCKTYD